MEQCRTGGFNMKGEDLIKRADGHVMQPGGNIIPSANVEGVVGFKGLLQLSHSCTDMFLHLRETTHVPKLPSM